MPQIEKAIMGETKYYLYSETKTLSKITDSEYIKAFIPTGSFSVNSEINASVGNTGTDYSSDEVKQIKNYFDNVKLNTSLGYNKDEGKALIDAKIGVKNTTVGEARLDVDGSAVGLGFPNLISGQFVLSEKKDDRRRNDSFN